MTDPLTAVAERLKALDNAVLINVLTKAKTGDTITATDWREARRIARNAGLVGDLPWHHPTLTDLANAIGVTTRSLELWRKQGCPLPAADGPCDELAVRLWHAAGPGRKGGKRAAALTAPAADAALAPYVALLTALHAAYAEDHEADPTAALKREQTIAHRLQNAERRKRFLDQARSHFDGLLGRWLAAMDQESATLAPQLSTVRHLDGAEAEARLRRLVREACERAAVTALRRDAKD